eukprot:6951340-Prymnesium_polylepis.1
MQLGRVREHQSHCLCNARGVARGCTHTLYAVLRASRKALITGNPTQLSRATAFLTGDYDDRYGIVVDPSKRSAPDFAVSGDGG